MASYNSSKNLTEYNTGTDHITKDIMSIYQSYETSNGKALVQLNESSFSSHPDMFRVDKAPDITLYMASANDGLQEWATYNPPGPSMPGLLNMVYSKAAIIIFDITSVILSSVDNSSFN